MTLWLAVVAVAGFLVFVLVLALEPRRQRAARRAYLRSYTAISESEFVRRLGSREPEYIALALRIRGLLATALRVPFTQIHPATKFRDLFSMEFDGAAVDLLITIETVFSLQIPGDVVEHIETVEDLARYLYTVRRSAPSNDCD
ncbi:MAG TPA: hypothetical protein VMY37_30350 [Thermoguttaceae bacterium]|nr:hypothetical protein [Thermoguttaceae bacterium]